MKTFDYFYRLMQPIHLFLFQRLICYATNCWFALIFSSFFIMFFFKFNCTKCRTLKVCFHCNRLDTTHLIRYFLKLLNLLTSMLLTSDKNKVDQSILRPGDKIKYEAVQTSNSLWENENLSQIPYKVLRGHQKGVTFCRFFRNDRCILSCSKDGNTQLWDASTGVILHTYASHQLPVTKCQISENEKKIVSSSWDKTVCFIDTETGNVLWRGRHDGIVTSCDLSPDGKLVLSCCDFDNSIKIWDAKEGSLVQEIFDHHTSTPTCCVFSPNGQRIASTGMDRVTKVWDLVSKQTTITLEGHKNIVSSCCFCNNERYLATTSWDKALHVWDISTGMFRSQGPGTLERGHEGSVSCCKFSKTAQYLVSGGYDDAIVVWEVENRSKKIVLKGHDGWINGVDISNDGRWILSCSDDKTIRVWNIEAANYIPAVIENRKAMGLKIVQCERCSKPFSIAQLDDPSDISLCVFCRLADPERNRLPAL